MQLLAQRPRRYPIPGGYEDRLQDGQREWILVSSSFMVIEKSVPSCPGYSLTSCSTPTVVKVRSRRSAAPRSVRSLPP